MSFARRLRAALLATAATLALSAGLSAHAQIVEVGDGGPGPFKAPHLTVELTTLSNQIAAAPSRQAS